MNNQNPLVSIVSPCYNGENYIGPFLESVLKQDYDHYELIIVNDGSTDGSEAIIKSYKDRFEEKKVRFVYVYQENAGQAQAVNTALQYVNGKYLSWVDSDDILHNNYLSVKCRFMEQNPELSMVISPVNVVDEKNPSEIKKVLKRKKTKKDKLLHDFICYKNVYYPPGGYMVRTEDFFRMYPEKRIIVSREGQNIQMIFPMAYEGKYGYIEEPLYDYVIHGDSHSHQKRDYETAKNRAKNISNLMYDVIKNLPVESEEKQRALELIRKEEKRKLLYIANSYARKADLKKLYTEMKRDKAVTIRETWIYCCSFFKGWR